MPDSREVPALIGGGAKQTLHELADLRGESLMLMADASQRRP